MFINREDSNVLYFLYTPCHIIFILNSFDSWIENRLFFKLGHCSESIIELDIFITEVFNFSDITDYSPR